MPRKPRKNAQILRLSPKQEKALVALLDAPTIRSAARQAGVAESTIREWLTQPAFADAYADERARNLTANLQRSQLATNRALRALERQLHARSNETVRKAAIAIIDRTLRITEQREVIDRLKAIEGKMDGGQHSQTA